MESEKNTSSKSDTKSTKSGSSQKSGMKSSQLMELFGNGLKDLYWAEKALVNALPKMTKNATSELLIDAMTSHLEETKVHVTRLEEVFSLIGIKAEAKKCDAMKGLIEEASGIMEECEEGSMRDAGIIAAAQKIEHYEIASYGTLRQFAETLGLEKAAELLETTLQEEKEADLKLSDVAMDAVNVEAAAEPS